MGAAGVLAAMVAASTTLRGRGGSVIDGIVDSFFAIDDAAAVDERLATASISC